MKNKIVSFTYECLGELIRLKGRVKNDPENEKGLLLDEVEVKDGSNDEAIELCFIPWHLVHSEVKILIPEQ